MEMWPLLRFQNDRVSAWSAGPVIAFRRLLLDAIAPGICKEPLKERSSLFMVPMDVPTAWSLVAATSWMARRSAFSISSLEDAATGFSSQSLEP
jgi:hypothetical protein